MKSVNRILVTLLVASAAAAANAQYAGQYVTDGPFGPIASAEAPAKRGKADAQMMSATERAMANADRAATQAARPATAQKVDAKSTQNDFFAKIPDTAL